MKLVKTLQLSCIVALTSMITSNVVAQTLYKWVDADGNISYQDQPPPENAKILDEIDVKKSAVKSSGSAVRTDPIKIYTVADCPPCAKSVSHLIALGVPHVELPLEEDRAAQSLILEKTASLVAPTIMIGENMLQSPTNEALSTAIEKAGYKLAE